jgi:hypothetical protein
MRTLVLGAVIGSLSVGCGAAVREVYVGEEADCTETYPPSVVREVLGALADTHEGRCESRRPERLRVAADGHVEGVSYGMMCANEALLLDRCGELDVASLHFPPLPEGRCAWVLRDGVEAPPAQ